MLKEVVPIKRERNLFNKLISDDNLSKAIDEDNRTHRWKRGHRPNGCTAWIEETKPERIEELRNILINGFIQKEPRVTKRYDASARKYRLVSEPIQWPDQYVHHALIQVIQPVCMRGMDPYCCGSIRGRGTQKARKAISGWMVKDPRRTKYEFCGDIRHFYDSLKPEVVMDRMRQLIKDHRILDLIWSIIKEGVLIGAYTSQWFANTVLQPLDNMIRQSGLCSYYVRYMDNLTLFGSNKRKLKKLKVMVEERLNEKELKLKNDWQIFPVVRTEPKVSRKDMGYRSPKGRMPDAVGYRYGRGFILPRKHNLLRLKRTIAKYRWRVRHNKRMPYGCASGILSRLGQLKHCNNCNIYKRLFKGGRIVRELKRLVRKERKEEELTWSMYLELRRILRSSKQKELITVT